MKWERVVWNGVITNYEVSDQGDVRHINGRPKAIYYNPRTGYNFTTIYIPNYGMKSIRIARLVADAFLPPRPEGFQIDHRDDQKTNDKAENLRFVTQSENIKKRGKIVSRPRRWHRLPYHIIQQMRILAMFGLSHVQIGRILDIDNSLVGKHL